MMRTKLSRPVFDRDEAYESSARAIRWLILALVLITYPFAATGAQSLVVLTLVIVTAGYNCLRYIPRLLRLTPFGSRINTLAADHIFALALILLSGGLASPYYPLFFLLILSVIASYGIAGLAFSLASQLIITLALLWVSVSPLPSPVEHQFIIKIALLVLFCLVAEQSVQSRDEEGNERQRLLSLINSLSDAVLAVDEQGRVSLYNAAALALLNTNKNITGQSINELLPLHNKSGHHVDLLHLMADESKANNRQDLFYLAPDGSKITLDLTLTPVRVFGYGSDHAGGYMAVFRDITKQKTLDEERDEFISVTSHELRTPLAIAEATLSTALMPGYADMPAKARNLVAQAHDNVVFLSELIQDLTTLSHAERDDLQLQSDLIDINEFCEQLGRDYRTQAEAKKLKFELNLPRDLGSIVTSEHELREILQNFLTNALKYTKSGKITLSAERTGYGVEFAVHDTGIGIAASDKPKIFSKFFRSEDFRTRATGGTGLGLYITHKLAEKMHSRISYTSKLNHGSTFRILVPSTKQTDTTSAST
jgi:PAS domain S-box-containing protein